MGINSRIKSSSFRPSHTGMDSYRDSTSVGLRLASTLSSDRGQQQSINHHIFAMIKKKKSENSMTRSITR